MLHILSDEGARATIVTQASSAHRSSRTRRPTSALLSLSIATTLLLAGAAMPASPASAATASVASVTSGVPITNAGSNLCLGIQNSSRASGAVALQGHCGGTPTQTWHVRASIIVGGELASQYQNETGNCLGVSGSSQASGAQVVQGTCSGTNDHSQFWAWGYYSVGAFVNVHSGPSSGCMGIQGSSLLSGARVLQGTCRGTPTQIWY
jgi:Ricin-type beta-trefoil lectin domain